LQTDRSSLVVVVAFEATTPDLQSKIDTVLTAFEGRFGDLLIAVHTIDKGSEIAGGCSNKNNALRTALAYVQERHDNYATTFYTATTCDTDSLFHPTYFKVLERAYNARNAHCYKPTTSSKSDAAAVAASLPDLCVWQPAMFYNWDLDERPFFVRVQGIVRAMMMLGGLISFNLNPMSIFSCKLFAKRLVSISRAACWRVDMQVLRIVVQSFFLYSLIYHCTRHPWQIPLSLAWQLVS
jgi:hypothetical protein